MLCVRVSALPERFLFFSRRVLHLLQCVKTVETHRRSIMEKLQLDSVAELTKHAIREGITSIDF